MTGQDGRQGPGDRRWRTSHPHREPPSPQWVAIAAQQDYRRPTLLPSDAVDDRRRASPQQRRSGRGETGSADLATGRGTPLLAPCRRQPPAAMPRRGAEPLHARLQLRCPTRRGALARTAHPHCAHIYFFASVLEHVFH